MLRHGRGANTAKQGLLQPNRTYGQHHRQRPPWSRNWGCMCCVIWIWSDSILQHEQCWLPLEACCGVAYLRGCCHWSTSHNIHLIRSCSQRVAGVGPWWCSKGDGPKDCGRNQSEGYQNLRGCGACRISLSHSGLSPAALVVRLGFTPRRVSHE